MLDITDENIRHKSIAVAVFLAQRRVLRKLSSDAIPSPQEVADICLRIFCLLHQGQSDEECATALEVLETATCATGAAVDVGKLGQTLQDSLDAATAMEFTALERSVVPEVQKTQKRKRIRVRMEPYRMSQRRIALDGVYDENGVVLMTAADVGNEIAREWSSVFQERATIEEDMDWFLGFVPQDAGRTTWTWPVGRMPATGPGPDGLLYIFGAEASDHAVNSLDRLAIGASGGASFPDEFLPRVFPVFIQNGECATDDIRVIRRAKELRPITLMQSPAKLIAAVSKEELSDIAQRTVSPQQRGFVPGRVMPDNIEVEGGSASCLTICLQ